MHSQTNFITLLLIVVNLIALVKPTDDVTCSFNIASYDEDEPKERYIVILKNQIDDTNRHFAWMRQCANKHVQPFLSETASQTNSKNTVNEFSVKGKFYGYSGWFNAKFAQEQLAKRSEVLILEKDAPVKIQYVIPRAVQNKPNPNLDRIDQVDFPLDRKYIFPDSAGSGVTVYVVDTGVLITHSEFEGRATFGGSFCDGCPQTDDEGHGSHVSGIIAGKTFGVAKKANIIGVKVLDGSGAGTNVGVINGLTFVLDQHTKKNQSSIVNMSLGGGFSQAVNAAIKKLTDAGVHVIVAAGNENQDACNTSPASEPSAITVGATETDSDNVADFSNIGTCVDIFAPGRDILSVGIKSNSDTATLSGTSQASPHVAGTIALIIAKSGDASPADMQTKLINMATQNILKNIGSTKSPNVFLRVPSP